MAQSCFDLGIYKLSHSLAIEIHQVSMELPKFEMYEEGSQIRRASKSVPCNIVEGFGRKRYKNEFIKFLIYSLASCNETIEHLKILYETGSFEDSGKYEYFQQKYNELGKMLNSFIKSVDIGHKT